VPPAVAFTVSLACVAEDGRIGAMGLALAVKAPPSGGARSACRLGSRPCAKEGQPVIDLFRAECGGLADRDLPIQYHFCLRQLGERTTIWFAYSAERRIDLLLPTGEFVVLAAVPDVLGAEAAAEEDTVSTASAARCQNAGSSVTTQQLTPVHWLTLYNLLLQIAVGPVNLVVTCLAIELDRLAAAASETVAAAGAQERRAAQLEALMQADYLAAPSSDYA
jgi:hypothetical protein